MDRGVLRRILILSSCLFSSFWGWKDNFYHHYNRLYQIHNRYLQIFPAIVPKLSSRPPRQSPLAEFHWDVCCWAWAALEGRWPIYSEWHCQILLRKLHQNPHQLFRWASIFVVWQGLASCATLGSPWPGHKIPPQRISSYH